MQGSGGSQGTAGAETGNSETTAGGGGGAAGAGAATGTLANTGGGPATGAEGLLGALLAMLGVALLRPKEILRRFIR